MKRTSVPKPLQEVLGHEGTAAFVEVLNRQQDVMTDDIARAVARALEPRFASIEARLDQCATKADLATCAKKADLAGFATKADLATCAKKADLTGFATKADLEVAVAGVRADLAGFATKADLEGFAKQSAVDRLVEKQEAFAVALERGLGGIRADMAGQRADMLKWMFLFWVGQAFVVLAYLRAVQ
ncbi:MAG TPA: hypothetical protein VMN81_03295 [Vicinamibacterales bacterium]|nr:hypothetical protein [Vicinamibacterales bacterium]